MIEREHTASLWHNKMHAQCIGCPGCPDYKTCGGISIEGGAFSCHDFCCDTPKRCQNVCPKNPTLFVARWREVGGHILDVPAGTSATVQLPPYVPIIYHKSSRARDLNVPVAAVSLSKLLRKTGKLRATTKQELCQFLRVPPTTRIVLDGVGNDRYLERYWEKRTDDLIQSIARLKPDLMMGPNFSLFADVPRWTDMHNMKRIAICWQQLSAAGIPTSLHVNARTDHDWERWIEFLNTHTEISAVSFEFGTGAGYPTRAPWYVESIIELAAKVNRKLALVVRGGKPYLAKFQQAFETTFIDTNSFMKATKRKKLLIINSKERWISSPTREGEPIDNLLEHNIETTKQSILAPRPQSPKDPPTMSRNEQGRPK